MARSLANPKRSYRKRSPSARREELRAIACKVFADKGYAVATMSDVAAAAGIHPSSLYHHFPTKDDILVETLQVFWSQLIRDYRQAAAHDDDLTALTDLIQVAFDYLGRRRAEVILVYNDWVRLSSLDKYRFVVAANEEAEAIWVSVLERGAQNGTFRSDINGSIHSRVLHGAILSTARWYQPTGSIDRAQLVAKYTELFLRGLLTRTPTKRRRKSKRAD